jgi:2-polyprenyl-3-methyl-5-hydroxy-6-metoxy-1,4-benzoquinol methylase
MPASRRCATAAKTCEVAGSIFKALRSWAADSDTVRGWREGRYRLFVDACAIAPTDRIIDVGAGWGALLERFNRVNPIVALDLHPQPSEWLSSANVTVVQADATQIPFGDAEFDVAFSNSVIEHIPPELQRSFAAEVARVATRYFVQTPNRYFPIEPHYQLPLFQFLPRSARKALNRRFTLGWQPKGQWEEITLLSARDLARLFPDAEIRREKVLGLTKSLIAVRR